MKRSLLVVLCSIALFIFSYVVYLMIAPSTADIPSAPQAPSAVANIPLVVHPTDPQKGVLQPKVTVIMVASFTCQSCRAAAVTIDRLVALYPHDVQIVWKDLPETRTGDSVDAANAARCAQQQGKFWQYHDALFQNQDVLYDLENYGKLADKVGLQRIAFDACFSAHSQNAFVEQNALEATQAGVTAVPYFQINQRITAVGNQSLSYFTNAIDTLLQNNQ